MKPLGLLNASISSAVGFHVPLVIARNFEIED